MIPLSNAREGETVVIRKITGNGREKQRLAALGFVQDGAVTVVSELYGNQILLIKGCRIALCSAAASKILI